MRSDSEESGNSSTSSSKDEMKDEIVDMYQMLREGDPGKSWERTRAVKFAENWKGARGYF